MALPGARRRENIMKEINSFILYNDWYLLAKNLDQTEKGLLFDLLFLHSTGGPLPGSIPKSVSNVFDYIKIYLDRDKQKYIDKCKKNEENIRKRYEARQNKNKKSESFDLEQFDKSLDDD